METWQTAVPQHPRKGGNLIQTLTSQISGRPTATLARKQWGRHVHVPTLDSSVHLCHLMPTTGATSVSLSLLSSASAARTDESQQVPLGCHMEQSSHRNSKAWTYALCSTVAEKDEPGGRVHVAAAIRTHLPSLAPYSSACARPGRKSESGGPVALREWAE